MSSRKRETIRNLVSSAKKILTLGDTNAALGSLCDALLIVADELESQERACNDRATG